MNTRMNGRIGRGGLAAAVLLAGTLALPSLAMADLDVWDADQTPTVGLGDQVYHRRAAVVRSRPAAVVVRRSYVVHRGPVLVAPFWWPRLVVRLW